MPETTCNHCGREFAEDKNYCPWCGTPAPAQQHPDLAVIRRKFIFFMIGLVVFCAVMILWLPRVIA